MPTSKNIESPEKLYSYFENYKKDCKANPKKENIWNHRSESEVSLSREIPYTWNGFEVWLRKHKIITQLDHYRQNLDGRYAEYISILRAIDQEIYEDKFAGASAGIFQHQIIARDLGLTDSQKIDHNVKGGIHITENRFKRKAD